MEAICIKCGSPKKRAVGECPSCKFLPTSDEERAKSLILSTGYEIDDDYFGKSDAELLEISKLISRGGTYDFSQKQIDELIDYAHQVEAITSKELLIGLVQWLWRPILFGLFLAWFAFGFKGCDAPPTDSCQARSVKRSTFCQDNLP